MRAVTAIRRGYRFTVQYFRGLWTCGDIGAAWSVAVLTQMLRGLSQALQAVFVLVS
jgi:hypothetical protein